MAVESVSVNVQTAYMSKSECVQYVILTARLVIQSSNALAARVHMSYLMEHAVQHALQVTTIYPVNVLLARRAA